MRNNQWMLLTGAVAVGLMVGGCSKKQDVSSPANSAVEPASQAAATAANPAPVKMTTEENSQVQDLQLQVEAYEKINKRKPASLQQMVQEGFLPSIPPAPPGKRFAYDPSSGRVNLAP